MSTDQWTDAVKKARRTLGRLSFPAKIAIARHDFAAVDPLAGVVAFDYADGPNGIRGHHGATAFPSMLALAATFDTALAADYGTALGRETLAAGRNAVFAPGLDIVRVPWGGRGGQQLSEDPFLAGEMGGTIGQGVQGQGVLAIAAHWVGNNFEWLRTGTGSLAGRTPAINVQISTRALHEVYAEPFRRALCRYGVAGLMGSYNQLNGDYVCHSRDLLNLPREHWGWAGVTVPDAVFAVRDPAAALHAGLDLPALGGDGGRTESDLQAVEEQALDAIVLHILTAAEHVGLQPAPPATDQAPTGSAALARRIAADGMVLLANRDDLLPLPPTSRIAVIDAVGVSHILVMGGAPSVSLVRSRIKTVPAALADALSHDQVVAVSVGHGEQPLPALSAHHTVNGIHATLHNAADETSRPIRLDAFELLDPPDVGSEWSATVETTIRAVHAGLHTLTAEFAGQLSVSVDGVELTSGFREASPMITGPEYPLHAVLDLGAGQTVTVRVEYTTSVAITIPGLATRPHLRLGLAEPDDQLARAVAAAAECDVAVVLAGRLSGEAMDIESFQLPPNQQAVVNAVTAANPATVLVTLGAGPIALPDRNVSAVLHAWFPGEQFAPALADVLTGTVEPGGRLPITFPTDDRSTLIQSIEQYPGLDGTASYTEDLLVGYRWYADHHVPVAFPFGHGLGYTTTEINDFDLQMSGDKFEATVHLINTGTRTGKAVPQIYVSYSPEAREPTYQLKGFAAVRLDPGEAQPVTITITHDDLKIFDDALGGRRLPNGGIAFRAALSSTDPGIIRSVHMA